MVRYRIAGRDVAADLALLWDRANARRIGSSLPERVDRHAVDALAHRLAVTGTIASIAEQSGDVVAGCFVQPFVRSDGTVVDGLAHLSGLAVEPGRWGEGLASGVLTRAVEAVGEQGVRRVQLHVLEENHRARRLYEHLGWRLVELGVPHPEGGPQAVYELAIDRLGPAR